MKCNICQAPLEFEYNYCPGCGDNLCHETEPPREDNGQDARSSAARGSANLTVYAVFVNGVFLVAYPRRVQAEVYATGLSGKNEAKIVELECSPNDEALPQAGRK
jgi:hypothetical protein